MTLLLQCHRYNINHNYVMVTDYGCDAEIGIGHGPNFHILALELTTQICIRVHNKGDFHYGIAINDLLTSPLSQLDSKA